MVNTIQIRNLSYIQNPYTRKKWYIILSLKSFTRSSPFTIIHIDYISQDHLNFGRESSEDTSPCLFFFGKDHAALSYLANNAPHDPRSTSTILEGILMFIFLLLLIFC